ncbi:pentapeptide repeat-containing protein [Rhodococcus jostii]|uniref:pentapeptide repeat-containing protein n=1 Tax=Rhodococcus jostii TaxID=132919 RepID=UPI0013C333EC|nr:pentapeptide repeat-containing protein [Rhodococcus jostii]
MVFLFQSSFEAQRELTSSRDELVRAFRDQVSTQEGVIDRSYREMRGMNLSGIELPGVILRDSDLSHIVLSSADLTNADLTRANLDGAQLQKITLSNSKLNGASIIGANLEEAALDCPLSGDDSWLPGTRSCKTENDQKDVDEKVVDREIDTRLLLADLTGSNLRFANLEGADLWSATVAGADLRGANMHETKLTNLHAQKARLNCIENPEPNPDPAAPKKDQCVDLRGATLWDADLRGANLSGADLTGARLNGAILGNTAYDRNRLRNVVLGDANLTGTTLVDICYDETTVWPFGFAPPESRDRDCPVRKTLDKDLRDLLDHIDPTAPDATVALSDRCQVDRVKWLNDVAINIANLEPLESPYVIESVDGPKATVRFTSSSNDAPGPGSGSWTYDDRDDTWKYDGC